MTFNTIKKLSYFSLVGFFFPIVGIMVSAFLIVKLKRMKNTVEPEKSFYQNLCMLQVKLFLLFLLFILSLSYVTSSFWNGIFLLLWFVAFIWSFAALRKILSQYVSAKEGGNDVKKVST